MAHLHPHSEPDISDIVLIGAGPVGLFGCFYAGMRGMSTTIVDSLTEPGGQLTALYPEKFVYDMPGFPSVLAGELADRMAEQGLRFGAKLRLGETVRTLEPLEGDLWKLTTDKSEHITRTIVICAGAGAFSPKKLPVDGLAEWEYKGVHYFVKDKSVFKDKRLLIVGGGDSALDWCRNLEPVSRSITLIHRRDAFRAHEESVKWLEEESRVDVRLFHELKALSGDDVLNRAVIFDNRTGDEHVLDIDAAIINIGFSASLGPIKTWGLEMAGPASIKVDAHMETNLPGVYSAGDVCAYEGKLKLIATGVGEVCTAVNYAKTRIDPSAKAFPGHSSNMEM